MFYPPLQIFIVVVIEKEDTRWKKEMIGGTYLVVSGEVFSLEGAAESFPIVSPRWHVEVACHVVENGKN